ncbi:MAG: hypothetical protein JW751_00865, partial [Polyangiaceae bacterium]|nr:hypothetical protein [Polyangiaceae bacterium]
KRSREEALDLFRKAAALPEAASSDLHRALGIALAVKGDFVEADQHFHQAYELTKPGAGAKANLEGLARLRAECGRLPNRLPELEAFLREPRMPELAKTALDLARLAAFTDRSLPAVALLDHVFSGHPELRADRCPFLGETARHLAAVEAARVGCGAAADAQDLGEDERSGWRERARQWLAQELEECRAELQSKAVKPAELRAQLLRWQHDERLAGLRQDGGLGMLPRQEQREWRNFWQAVDALIGQARSAGARD